MVLAAALLTDFVGYPQANCFRLHLEKKLATFWRTTAIDNQLPVAVVSRYAFMQFFRGLLAWVEPYDRAGQTVGLGHSLLGVDCLARFLTLARISLLVIERVDKSLLNSGLLVSSVFSYPT